ncbi:UBX domain-containing protein 6 [Diabrotica virgifera virgifera]|uniref:UBX domain-containing protein 6 n=1 Tax=Diabrotica virgifera virgifera TaxID=50390 RepID=A0A6P7FL63_DIAVI|nr:UBX domain-containing protein 6 [Diabrotica virgifera virgifera]
MAEKIKKFFAKKKADAKFKLAGPGHKLTESSSTASNQSKPSKGAYVPPKVEPTEAARQAAEAALVRLQGQRKDTAFNTSFAAIQAKVRKELEAETKNQNQPQVPGSPTKSTDDYECSHHLAVKGVYFKCPLISDEVLPKEEWKVKIKEFLFNTLEEERGMTSVLLIYSCNYNRTKVTDCVNVLIRYIDNILANPEETKFHKIRCSNATFCDKVMPVLGALDFLNAAGFRDQKIDNNGTEENFLVWSVENIDGLETLQFLRDTLKAEERVDLEIDRNIQVLSPAQAAERNELPQDFFAMTAEELKKERQQRSEQLEKQLQLRTKAMREKDEIREIKKYKFCLIRIRFPDGLFLQGTFSVYEKFSEVVEFVKENLEHEGLPFVLSLSTGHRLEESDKDNTLMDLRLVPATILLFQWDASIENDLKAAGGNTAYLKPEIMLLVQSL